MTLKAEVMIEVMIGIHYISKQIKRENHYFKHFSSFKKPSTKTCFCQISVSNILETLFSNFDPTSIVRHEHLPVCWVMVMGSLSPFSVTVVTVMS